MSAPGTGAAGGTGHDPRTCQKRCCRRVARGSVRTVTARPAPDRDWPVLDGQLSMFGDPETEQA